jgi:hypothetical protein
MKELVQLLQLHDLYDVQRLIKQVGGFAAAVVVS